MIYLDAQRRAHCYPCRADALFEKSGATYVCARGHRRQVDEPAVPPAIAAVAIRFWERVRKTPHCWNWEGSMRGGGTVPRLWVGDRDMSAAAVSWILATGVEPAAGLWFARPCHNVRCVRPEHIVVIKPEEKGLIRSARSKLFGPKPQAYCRRGHRLTPANRQRMGDKELCRACRTAWRRGWEKKRRRAAEETAVIG